MWQKQLGNKQTKKATETPEREYSIKTETIYFWSYVPQTCAASDLKWSFSEETVDKQNNQTGRLSSIEPSNKSKYITVLLKTSWLPITKQQNSNSVVGQTVSDIEPTSCAAASLATDPVLQQQWVTGRALHKLPTCYPSVFSISPLLPTNFCLHNILLFPCQGSSLKSTLTMFPLGFSTFVTLMKHTYSPRISYVCFHLGAESDLSLNSQKFTGSGCKWGTIKRFLNKRRKCGKEKRKCETQIGQELMYSWICKEGTLKRHDFQILSSMFQVESA